MLVRKAVILACVAIAAEAFCTPFHVAAGGTRSPIDLLQDVGAGENVGSSGNDASKSLSIEKGEESVYSGTQDVGNSETGKVDVPMYEKRSFVIITSRTEITIRELVVNKGNCSHLYADLPRKLNFGDRLKSLLTCDPIEVRVETDKGSVTFEWN